MIDKSGHLRQYRSFVGFENLNEPISVNCCGYQKFISKNSQICRPNGRVDYHIIYVVNGQGYFTLNHENILLTKGQFIVIPPRIHHEYYYLSDDKTEVYWIHFTGNFIGNILKRLNLSSYVYEIGQEHNLIHQFEKIISELQLKSNHYSDMSNAYFYELLCYLSRLTERQNPLIKEPNNLFAPILNKFHNEYHQKYTIDELARICNLSTYGFIHKFKDYTGYAPMHYLRNIRLNKARDLLINTSLSISEITHVIGYDNPLYFSRLFKKYIGISPTEFRKSNK